MVTCDSLQLTIAVQPPLRAYGLNRLKHVVASNTDCMHTERATQDQSLFVSRTLGRDVNAATKNRLYVSQNSPQSPRPCLAAEVPHLYLIDPAVESKGSLVKIVERHRRAEIGADVEAVVGGEEQRS